MCDRNITQIEDWYAPLFSSVRGQSTPSLATKSTLFSIYLTMGSVMLGKHHWHIYIYAQASERPRKQTNTKPLRKSLQNSESVPYGFEKGTNPVLGRMEKGRGQCVETSCFGDWPYLSRG